MRPPGFRLLALAIAVAVVVPVASFGRVAWACSMTGRVMDSCCCPAPSLAPTPAKASQIRAQDCCERRIGQPDAAITASADVAAPLPAAVLSGRVGIVEIAGPAAVSGAVPMDRSRAPPGARAPLFILNCSLLG